MKMVWKEGVLQVQLTITPPSFSPTVLLRPNVNPSLHEIYAFSSLLVLCSTKAFYVRQLGWSNSGSFVGMHCDNQITSPKLFYSFLILWETSIRYDSDFIKTYLAVAWLYVLLYLYTWSLMSFAASTCGICYRQGRKWYWCSLVYEETKSSPCEFNCSCHLHLPLFN